VFAADVALQHQLEAGAATGAVVIEVPSASDADSMEVDGEGGMQVDGGDSTWQEGYIALSVSEDRSCVVSVLVVHRSSVHPHVSLLCAMSDARACVAACRRAWSAAGCCQ
jgi:hypothetical protein